MPGYIMHLAEAGLILDKLEQKGCTFDADWRSHYELGALLPDVRRSEGKRYTHFRTEESVKRLVCAPCLPPFMEKYAGVLADPLVFGYLAHLHLDYCYMENYWQQILVPENAAGEYCDSREGTTHIRLVESGQVLARKDFFSADWYYGDYTALNRYQMQKYRIQVPAYPPVKPFSAHVEETDEAGLAVLLQELAGYLQEVPVQDGTKQLEVPQLKVLNAATIDDFLQETAEAFVNEFGSLLQ